MAIPATGSRNRRFFYFTSSFFVPDTAKTSDPSSRSLLMRVLIGSASNTPALTGISSRLSGCSNQL